MKFYCEKTFTCQYCLVPPFLSNGKTHSNTSSTKNRQVEFAFVPDGRERNCPSDFSDCGDISPLHKADIAEALADKF